MGSFHFSYFRKFIQCGYLVYAETLNRTVSDREYDSTRLSNAADIVFDANPRITTNLFFGGLLLRQFLRQWSNHRSRGRWWGSERVGSLRYFFL